MKNISFPALLTGHAFVLLLLLVGWVPIIALSGGKTFVLELIGFFILLILTGLGFIRAGVSRRTSILFFVYTLYLLNIALLWFVTSELYLVLLLLAVIGFVFAYPRRMTFVSDDQVQEQKEELHSMVFDPPKTKTKPSSGKYVASKRGKYYHEPKSEWAQKIKPENQVWFANKEAAWEAGYKAHPSSLQ